MARRFAAVAAGLAAHAVAEIDCEVRDVLTEMGYAASIRPSG